MVQEALDVYKLKYCTDHEYDHDITILDYEILIKSPSSENAVRMTT